MIYIRIEMWPGGDRANARVLGEATITNDGKGTEDAGNYNAVLFKSPEYAREPGVWKSGRVENFPRARLGPWDLLYRALRAMIGRRNP